MSETVNTMTRDDVIRETANHIRRVGTLVNEFASDLTDRAINHDSSKWSNQEWPTFEKVTPQLRGLTFGSEEYKAQLALIKPALDHHNAFNTHHPECHANGVADMTLVDLIEMLCDWKAAGERHANGSLARSLEIQRTRFKIDPAIMKLLYSTAHQRGWIKQEDIQS